MTSRTKSRTAKRNRQQMRKQQRQMQRTRRQMRKQQRQMQRSRRGGRESSIGTITFWKPGDVDTSFTG